MAKRVLTRLLFMNVVLVSTGVAAQQLAEQEPNHPIGTPQQIPISGASLAIEGVLGQIGGDPTDDIDFYSIHLRSGDKVDIDIDDGIGGTQDVDTYLALFGSAPVYAAIRWNDNSFRVDQGSTSYLDARIRDFVAPFSGTYTIGVTNSPRVFAYMGGGVYNASRVANGDYKLVVSIERSSMEVAIDIKPGTAEFTPINLKSRGKIPVAILSTARFNALGVDASSLRFGASGKERSLSRCGKNGEDVNGDARRDLVCHFDLQRTGFSETDEEGHLSGQTLEGQLITGHGMLKIVPAVLRE